MKLSVLDQSVIRKGGEAATTLQETVKLAQLTEELGFTRFWVAEHHNTNGIAGSSPEILISHIASKTKSIRVGSGGVLLPQYSPLKVSENFRVLEALFPNRIDLGIGRSPGGSPATRLALTDGLSKSLNEFPRQVKALQSFLSTSNLNNEVISTPAIGTSPEVWILGITHRGARVAAENGTAFTYGHFISPDQGEKSIDYYKNNFISSSLLPKPKTNVCIFVVCASTQEKAEELALSQDLWLLSVANREGRSDTRIPSVEEAKARSYTREERELMKVNRKRMIVGTPEKVREELMKLSEVYETDEFMIVTNIYSFEDKLQSYRLLAGLL